MSDITTIFGKKINLRDTLGKILTAQFDRSLITRDLGRQHWFVLREQIREISEELLRELKSE